MAGFMRIDLKRTGIFWTWLLLALGVLAPALQAAEVIPPSPSPHYIVDDAHVLSPATVSSVDSELADFEKSTSNQIVVALYPKVQTDDDIAAYSVRVFQAWKLGQKDRKNGVLLLVSVQDHRMTIQVGYGLEGALPDATAKLIIVNDIAPHFKTGDYDGGIQAGVNSIIAATKGEYKGTGHLGTAGGISFGVLIIIFFIVVFVIRLGVLYSSSGGSFWWALFWMFLGSGNNRGGGFGGGGFGGGGGGGDGGGGFSGGGGSSGGGGASGSW